jgi:hypothetical protein
MGAKSETFLSEGGPLSKGKQKEVRGGRVRIPKGGDGENTREGVRISRGGGGATSAHSQTSADGPPSEGMPEGGGYESEKWSPVADALPSGRNRFFPARCLEGQAYKWKRGRGREAKATSGDGTAARRGT